MATAVDLVAGNFPVGWCFSTWDDLLAQIVANITASISGTTNNFNYGPTTPNASQRDRPWHRTDSFYTPDRIYTWSEASTPVGWVAPHTVPPDVVWLYVGNIALIDTFDGGEAGTPSAFAGPMWEKLSAMDGRVPIGPGTMDQGTVVALAGTLGTEKNTLVEANLAPHTHVINGYAHSLSASTDQPTNQVIIDDDWKAGALSKQTAQGGGSGSPLAATPFSNVPPAYGIWFIKKTIRTHYRL